MCGPNLPRPSLGGALAVLSAPRTTSSCCESSQPPLATVPALRGSLVFHNQRRPGAPSTVATHATFTPLAAGSRGEKQEGEEEPDLSDYVVGIHASGDLLKPALQSPILHRFGFRDGIMISNGNSSSSSSENRTATSEVRLATPLEIGVGGDGIIGRRVTVWKRTPSSSSGGGGGADGGGGARAWGLPVAEGVVGYN